jgi:hypothetical protein
MTNIFQGPTAGELRAFLQFKRSLGYGYMRAEFTLREFDRFLIHLRVPSSRLSASLIFRHLHGQP